MLEVLKVALDVQLQRRDVDRLRVRCARTAGTPRADDRLHFEIEGHVGRAGSIAGERVARREIHAIAAAVDGRLQQLGELDEQRDAVRRARRATGIDARIRRRHEQPRRLAHRAELARRRRRHRQPRDSRPGIAHRSQLHVVIDHDEHRLHRGCHRDLVRPHRRLGKRRQRCRLVVPLHVVADDERHVLRAVIRVHAIVARPRIAPVARNDEHGHTIRVSVVDCHRRVLQTDVAMHQREHRLAFNLREAVRHRDRRFLVAARQQLRHLVIAVVDDRLVQPLEARSRIARGVLEAEALDHVDHEVRRGAFDDLTGWALRELLAEDDRLCWVREWLAAQLLDYAEQRLAADPPEPCVRLTSMDRTA